MAYDLAMLNRLRVNAGKSELSSWKAKKSVLREKIEELQAQGFVDALPGANIAATPKTEDPEILEKLIKGQEPPVVEDDDEGDDEPDEKPVTKVKTQLARGIETDGYAKHSRKAVQDIRRDERKDKKSKREKVKLEEADKKQIKDEADDRKKTVKKKANKKIADSKPKKGKAKKADKNSDEVTVADLARELDMDPKIARAKLRRHEEKPNYPKHTKGQDRWTFPKAAASELKKILKGGK